MASAGPTHTQRDEIIQGMYTRVGWNLGGHLRILPTIKCIFVVKPKKGGGTQEGPPSFFREEDRDR